MNGDSSANDNAGLDQWFEKALTLAEALQVEEIAVYGKRATGLKYLIRPND